MTGAAATKETDSFRTSDAVTLRYSLRRTGSRRVVLVVPGILMHRESPEHRLLGRRLAETCDVVTLDVRGHGGSEGRFTWGRREPEDVAELARQLRDRYDWVGGLGFSFGGYHCAVAAALHRPFDAVALVAAPRSLFVLDHNFLTRGLARSMPIMWRRERQPTRFGAPHIVGRRVPARLVDRISPVPLLILHGAEDWLIPPRHGRTLFERAKEPKALRIIDSGLHAENMLADDPEPLLRELADFFARS